MPQPFNNTMQPPPHLKTSHMSSLPALAVSSHPTTKAARQKYTDPPLQLIPSSTAALPAMAVRPRSPSSGSEDGGVKLPMSPRHASPALAVYSSPSPGSVNEGMKPTTPPRPATPALAVWSSPSPSPALAVDLRPSVPMPAAQPAERHFAQKLHEYHTVRRQRRNAPSPQRTVSLREQSRALICGSHVPIM